MKNCRKFLRYTILKVICAMCSTSIFKSIMTRSLNLWYFFIFSMFIFRFIFRNTANFCIFFSLKLITPNACSLKDLQNFFHAFFIIFVFYTFKWRYCWYWKTSWNMFTNSCCGYIFRIIFTSINVFYQTFKTCVNNK